MFNIYALASSVALMVLSLSSAIALLLSFGDGFLTSVVLSGSLVSSSGAGLDWFSWKIANSLASILIVRLPSLPLVGLMLRPLKDPFDWSICH